MSPLILLALLVGTPLVIATLLRVKPLYLFVSIITGYFWAQFLGDTATFMLRSILHVSHLEVVIQVGLLLIPVVLTFMLMRKTLSASALPFQFILLASDSLLLALFLIPLLTPAAQNAIYQTSVGNIFRQANEVSIAAIAGLHVLVMFFMRPRPHGKHSRKHH